MEHIRIEQGTLKNKKWQETEEGQNLAVFQGEKRIRVFHLEERNELFDLLRVLLPRPVVLGDDEFFEQIRKTTWKEELIQEFAQNRDQAIESWTKDNDPEMVAFEHEEYNRYVEFLDLLFSEQDINDVVKFYNRLDTAPRETVMYMLQERFKQLQM